MPFEFTIGDTVVWSEIAVGTKLARDHGGLLKITEVIRGANSSVWLRLNGLEGEYSGEYFTLVNRSASAAASGVYK